MVINLAEISFIYFWFGFDWAWYF